MTTAGNRPTRIAIEHDDYHAAYVGHTADGRQFFLTTPFELATNGSEGQEFVVLFLFDTDGQFLDAKIDAFGPRATLDHAARRTVHDARLAGLGDVTLDRIEIAPFQIERYGIVFGLIPRKPEDADASWWVELQPGNYAETRLPGFAAVAQGVDY